MTYLLEIRGGNGWEAVRTLLTSLTILSTSFGSTVPAAKSFSILDTICSAVVILMVVYTEVVYVVADSIFPVTKEKLCLYLNIVFNKWSKLWDAEKLNSSLDQQTLSELVRSLIMLCETESLFLPISYFADSNTLNLMKT